MFSDQHTNKIRPFSPWSIIVLVTFLTFYSSLQNEFLNWDDGMFVYENPSVQTLDWKHIKNLFTTTEAGGYTPLSRLSIAIDYAIWKKDPFGFRLTALLFHILNACLVFSLAKILIKQSLASSSHTWNANSSLQKTAQKLSAIPGNGSAGLKMSSPQEVAIGALLASLLFAIHPMRVESVVWISERRDVLSGFFGLLSTLAYVRYLQSLKEEKGLKLWFPLSFVFFIAGVFSKAILVGLPIVFIFLDLYPFGRLAKDREILRQLGKILIEKSPFLLISAAVGLGTMDVVLNAGLAKGMHQVGLEPRIAQSLIANTEYIVKLLFPIHLNPLDKLYHKYQFHQPQVISALIFNSVVTLFLILQVRRFPSALVAWCSYLIIIGPVLGVAHSGLQLTADRYTYFSTISFCVLFGGIFSFLWNADGFKKCRKLVSVITLLLILVFGVRSYFQTKIWKNSRTLWTHSLSLDPYNPFAWLNLGVAVAADKGSKESGPYFAKALALAPTYREAAFNQATVLYLRGDMDAAIHWYRYAVELDPEYHEARFNLANLLALKGSLKEARRHYFLSLQDNHTPNYLTNLAIVLHKTGQSSLAIKYLAQAAVQNDAPAYTLWAKILAQHGEFEQARSLLQTGYRHTRDIRILKFYNELILKDPKLPDEARQKLVLQLREVRKNL